MNVEYQCEQKPSILVVDDKPQNLFALKKLLDNPEYDVLAAVSGNDALALALEHDFSVILMDVQMPGMNGFETANLLSLDEATKHIPIIFVTAHHSDTKNMSLGYASGAVDYLSKPLNPEILKGKINVFLALNKQKAALATANKKLEEANRAKGEFLDKVGDKLRKPLFTVMGLTKDLMEKGQDKGFDETAAALLEQAGKLITATNALFEFASTAKRENRLRPKHFNLHHVLRDVDYVLGLRARERCLSYRCTMSPDVPQLLVGDSARLRQIIVTMITHGVKFSHQGEVSVQVDLEQDLEDRTCLRFSMRENGKDEKSLEWRDKALQVFESFKPVQDKEDFECPGGPALGLTIARQLVEAMGGKTGIEILPNGGLDFWFTAKFHKQQPDTAKTGALPPPQKPIATILRAKEKPAKEWSNGIFNERPPENTCSWPAPFRA